MSKDRIAAYISKAKELVVQNQPKAARAYVLASLDEWMDLYKKVKTIPERAEIKYELTRWLSVAKDLYDLGITNNVKEAFGLVAKKTKPECPSVTAKPTTPVVTEEKKAGKSGGGSGGKSVGGKSIGGKSIGGSGGKSSAAGDIDYSGLFSAESHDDSQGWCADVFENNKNAVVEISVECGGFNTTGTGFIISDKGYFLTNDHVIFDETNGCFFTEAKMKLFGSKKKYKMQVLFSDKKNDVALCRFNPRETSDFSVIKRIDDYSRLSQGADCLVIGNAFGMGLAPFSGVVRFTKNDYNDLVYTAPSNPGDSGGPVLSRHGECIGINKSKTLAVNNVSAEGYANATPMDIIEELLKKWCAIGCITL